MTWNVFHRYMGMSNCHSFGSRELAIRYACGLLDDGKEARRIAPGARKMRLGGHEIRLMRAGLT
jgi:hypothetical protein